MPLTINYHGMCYYNQYQFQEMKQQDVIPFFSGCVICALCYYVFCLVLCSKEPCGAPIELKQFLLVHAINPCSIQGSLKVLAINNGHLRYLEAGCSASALCWALRNWVLAAPGCWTGACSGIRRNNEFEPELTSPSTPACIAHPLGVLHSECSSQIWGSFRNPKLHAEHGWAGISPHQVWNCPIVLCQSHSDDFTPSPGLVWIFTFHIYITFWIDMREATLQLSPRCWRNNFTFFPPMFL